MQLPQWSVQHPHRRGGDAALHDPDENLPDRGGEREGRHRGVKARAGRQRAPQGYRTWHGALLPLPACHKGVYARLRRAMERVGVRGRLHKLRLATQSLWRGPLTRNLREECANSDLSMLAGEVKDAPAGQHLPLALYIKNITPAHQTTRHARRSP